MERKERFNAAFQYLRGIGLAHTQKDLVIRMGKDASNVSKAFRGNEKILTDGFLKDFNKAYSNMFNIRWLLRGEGDMLEAATINRNMVDANNASNSIVGYSNNNCNVIVGGDGEKVSESFVLPNKYGDSPNAERGWRPVVPANMARQSDFDIMGHIEKQINGNFERLYSGTAPVDIWHYLEDNDLYPFFQKGDCIGLKAYPLGDTRIKTGDVYAVDTKRDGLIVRRCRLSVEGDIVTYTYNDTDPQEFVIPKDDVIRIFKKVLMFRY